METVTDLQKELIDCIEAELQRLDIPQQPVSVYEPYKYALSVGGKRIRPLLTLLSCGLCGGDLQDALPAALSVEILHNFTLVHDDIMDSAETRRGMQSVYKKWNKNTALLSGDLMFADAYQKLNYYGRNDSFSKQEFTDIHEVFLKTTVIVCEGQALDMEFVDRQEVSREEYLQMIGGKTAALLSGAMEMGAITAHEMSHKRKELADLGYELGIAFQIQDDLLDAVADPEKFGKRPGGDIFEGKKTYLTIIALERANEQQSALIQEVLDQPQPNEHQIQQVLELFVELKVIDDVAEVVQNHYQRAADLLSHFTQSTYKQELQNLLSFLRNRDY